jgi:hypothetical protein
MKLNVSQKNLTVENYDEDYHKSEKNPVTPKFHCA